MTPPALCRPRTRLMKRLLLIWLLYSLIRCSTCAWSSSVFSHSLGSSCVTTAGLSGTESGGDRPARLGVAPARSPPRSAGRWAGGCTGLHQPGRRSWVVPGTLS